MKAPGVFNVENTCLSALLEMRNLAVSGENVACLLLRRKRLINLQHPRRISSELLMEAPEVIQAMISVSSSLQQLSQKLVSRKPKALYQPALGPRD